jgi:hypothetical protein
MEAGVRSGLHGYESYLPLKIYSYRMSYTQAPSILPTITTLSDSVYMETALDSRDTQLSDLGVTSCWMRSRTVTLSETNDVC